jgi:hypothetical protein
MASKIAIIILVLLALGAGIFVFRGVNFGAVAFPSLPGFSSSTFSFLPGGAAVKLPTLSEGSPAPYGSSTTYLGPGPGGSTTSITVATGTIPASQIPKGWTASQLSPYFHEVRITGVSYGGANYYGTITLNAQFANYGATGTIDITGWHIKARAGGEFIPTAIAVYDPSGLTAPSDIRLNNGDIVYLYSSSAPFNVRLNECIGWIAQVAHFSPPLPAYCAPPDESSIQNFTGACQEYVQTLGGCQQPDLSNPLIPRTDYACQDFLENNFNYRSCFTAHRADPNFLSNQVWVWMGSNVVNRYHDTVDLLDKNGLLVDQYVY